MRWLLLLVLISTCFAGVKVYYPVYAELNDWENVFIGKAGPGHEVTLITDRGPRSDPWSSAEGERVISYEPVGNRFKIVLSAPEEEGTAQICIALKGKESSAFFCPTMIVEKNVVNAEADEYSESCAGFAAEVNVLLENNSVGSTVLKVNGEEVPMEEKSKTVKKIRFLYPLPGVYTGKIVVEDEKSGWKKEMKVDVLSKKCVFSEFLVAGYAFPLTNVLLLPAYILGAVFNV